MLFCLKPTICLIKFLHDHHILGSPKPPKGNQVKHTLIILSLLLLSFPLFGQETGVLYQYETSLQR